MFQASYRPELVDLHLSCATTNMKTSHPYPYPTYLMRSIHPFKTTLCVKKNVTSMLVNLHCQSRTLTLRTHYVQPYKSPTSNPHLIFHMKRVDLSGKGSYQCILKIMLLSYIYLYKDKYDFKETPNYV